MKQKFYRGNVVELLVGHQIWNNNNGKIETIDMRKDLVGKKAIIQGSYNDLFGMGHDVFNQYSILFIDTNNSMAWIPENHLKLISKGGEYMFKKVMKNKPK